MSYANLIQPGFKPSQNLDINNLRVETSITTGELNVQKIENGMLSLPLVKAEAFDLDQEISTFTATIANVDGTQKEVDTLVIVNQGEFTYAPEINVGAKSVVFSDVGLYSISLHILPTSGFLTSEVVNVRFFDEADIAGTRYVECVCAGSGAPANTAGFTLSGLYPKTLPGDKSFTLQFLRLAGAGTPSFAITGTIAKIK